MGIDWHAQVELRSTQSPRWWALSRWELGKDASISEAIGDLHRESPLKMRRGHPAGADFDEEEREIIDQGLYWCTWKDFPRGVLLRRSWLSLEASLEPLQFYPDPTACRVLFWQT